MYARAEVRICNIKKYYIKLRGDGARGHKDDAKRCTQSLFFIFIIFIIITKLSYLVGFFLPL